MNGDIRDRLRRLGVHKGAADLKPATARGDSPSRRESPHAASNDQPPVSAPLWNLEQQTAFGVAYLRRTVYPAQHRHGGWMLQQALDHPQRVLERLNGGAPVDLRRAVFLDTETTGLAGGAGTLVFLVGLGYFAAGPAGSAEPEIDSFIVDQYFLHEPAQEAAMLAALDAHLSGRQSLVTFNGRGFDVPLLETRYTLARIAPALSDLAHLDLLLPARRAWRSELGSCSLGSLEYHMLDVRRDQQDIPGFLIPELYREYLHTREPAEMQRVMYHNLHDILSLVALVTRLGNAVDAPASPGEYLAAGQYYERHAQWREAEEIYSAALAALGQGNLFQQQRVLHQMAVCLKRQERYAQAAPYWRRLAETGDADAWLELAKHYEWREVDLAQALTCSRAALGLCREPYARAEVAHRIERLDRKLSLHSQQSQQ